jgi:SAM-dependent methyltransferase
MTRDLLRLLACPGCGSDVSAAHEGAGDQIEAGGLRCAACDTTYPIVRSVPRFVPADNYAGSFGFQWNRFRRTQLDSSSGHPISRDRFFAQSGWSAGEMAGRRVLDLGCGAGRFAEVALSTGAHVVAVDYSAAVDAASENLGSHPRLDVVQGDVFRLPFKPQSFDFVYCFGVLQHTPDVHGAFVALTRQVCHGGRLAVDVYPKLAANVLWPKYWLRPITRRIAAPRLFPAVEKMVDVLWPLSVALGRFPFAGRKLRHAIPIVNYEGLLPLSLQQLKEWAVLDTFDMLSPAHDHPQSVETLRRWFDEAELTQVEVFRDGLVVGRGTQSSGRGGATRSGGERVAVTVQAG